MDSLHQQDYQNWYVNIGGITGGGLQSFGTDSLRGCRYFWRGEFLVCRDNQNYVSLKLSSKNTVGAESINNENRKGAWLGMGVLSLYRHGNDFENIYPLWDWNLLPGTTSHRDCVQIEKRITNESEFAGGVVDGKIAVAALIAKRKKLEAYKSWYFLGNVIICLGSNIKGNADTEIETSVDQRMSRGSVYADGFLNGEIKSARKVWHDSIGYFSLDGKVFSLKNEKRKGNWSEIGTEKRGVQGKILSLWKRHGKNPKSSHYRYLMEMGIGINEFEKKNYENIMILQNDSLAQVVYDEKKQIWAGVAYSRVRMNFSDFHFFTSHPCVFSVC